MFLIRFIAAGIAWLVKDARRGGSLRVDASRLRRLVLAGAIAGLLVFVIFNSWATREESKYAVELPLSGGEDIFDFMGKVTAMLKHLTEADPLGAFLFTGTFAALLGGLLTWADQMGMPWRRIVNKAFHAVLCGVLVGGISGVAADFIFTRLGRICWVFLFPGQLAGWILMGLGAGASIGLTLGSKKRMIACIWGGVFGGFLGQTAFGLVSMLTFSQSGTPGRLLGFPIFGALIGLAVSLAEDLGKRFWVTVLSGPKEGRQYILGKPVTTIGRDELADIPLFGDSSVARLHATLRTRGYNVELHSEGGSPVIVNGVGQPSCHLRTGDIIQIGKFRLRFHDKVLPRSVAFGGPQYGYPGYPQQVAPRNPNPTMVLTPPSSSRAGVLTLTITGGPHASHTVSFPPGSVLIGRESDCTLSLFADPAVSRHHAEIAFIGSGWFVRDLGSTNGLAVNGIQCQSAALNPGDQIGIGQTVFRVDGT